MRMGDMIKKLGFIILTLVFLVFTGCSPKIIDNTEELREKDEEIAALEQRVEVLESELTGITSNNIYRVIEVIGFMKNKDMNSLSQYIHPTKGIRFTPYFFTDTENDKVFTAEEAAGLMNSTEIINWGVYDGSGEPINLIFGDYYDKFVYDKDFANPQVIGNNVPIGIGNIIDNTSEAYPNGYFVELHFPGFDPQFQGIDWESLRLVFEEYNNTWYLVGVVHGQWTI
jgi:hypothetical protein